MLITLSSNNGIHANIDAAYDVVIHLLHKAGQSTRTGLFDFLPARLSDIPENYGKDGQ